MLYLLVTDEGLLLKKTGKFFSLALPSDLRLLDIADVQEPNKYFVCTLANRDKCYALKVKTIPEGFVIKKDFAYIGWTAHHAIIAYETKKQLTQISSVYEDGPEKKLVNHIIGVLERIYER